MKYTIEIEEISSRLIEVDADNEKEAFDVVRRQYLNSEIILGENDFVDYEIRTFSRG